MAESLTGEQAESLACAYLQRAGLTLVERNYRCRQGELDLIMHDQETLVFIEVRYRHSSAFGSAAESVHGRKQARLLATAQRYLQEKQTGKTCRFDVIAISGQEPFHIDWIKDAIQAG